MRILSFDQSTRVTGWSIFDDRQYVASGVIDLHKIKDTDERSKQMAVEICKVIENAKPNCVIIEEVQQQSNVSTVIKLARIQGVAIGFCAAHNIELHILTPSRWRSVLGYKQGPKVKREDLKQQSLDFVKTQLKLDIESEDENEACAINEAAHRIFGWESEDDIWEI
jgi:Holliday junction resolvasome RuvABC endonuclease subunit